MSLFLVSVCLFNEYFRLSLGPEDQFKRYIGLFIAPVDQFNGYIKHLVGPRDLFKGYIKQLIRSLGYLSFFTRLSITVKGVYKRF